jgi:hypothetical protein
MRLSFMQANLTQIMNKESWQACRNRFNDKTPGRAGSSINIASQYLFDFVFPEWWLFYQHIPQSQKQERRAYGSIIRLQPGSSQA